MLKKYISSLCVAAAVCLYASAVAGEADGSKPAPGRDAKKAKASEELAELIRVIRTGQRPNVAMAAYARGNAIGPMSVELHDAYMKRMLKFGLPQVAYYPARNLVVIDKANGTAWGVIGYMEGRRGKFSAALKATIRAAELLKDDPSVLNNAGQLVAWYENTPQPPRIPDAVKRSLDRIHHRLIIREPFSKAFRRVKAAYEESARRRRQLDRKITAAEADARAVYDRAESISGEIRDVNDEIEYHYDLIDSLREELYYAVVYPRYVDALGQRVYVRPVDIGRREDIHRRIRDQKRQIDALKRQADRLRREGADVMVKYRSRLGELKRLRQQADQVAARLDRFIRWDPPAVDGVVVDEAEHFRPAQSSPPAATDGETEARQRLSLAKLYLANDMNERAAEILEDLLARHGGTKAAEQAKILLGAIGQMQ